MTHGTTEDTGADGMTLGITVITDMPDGTEASGDRIMPDGTEDGTHTGMDITDGIRGITTQAITLADSMPTSGEARDIRQELTVYSPAGQALAAVSELHRQGHVISVRQQEGLT